ncbi:MAG: penicillin-binding protein 2 [Patescibacteria group bacterium]
MKYSFSRTIILSVLILAFILIVVGKLFLLQIVHSSSYLERADRQYATPASNIFERGVIFMKSKDGDLVSLATQASGFKLAINPKQITDPEKVYERLSETIALEKDEFMEKAGRTNDIYEEVAHRLEKSEADKVSALKIPGVSVFKEKWRFYPGGTLGSHLVGFVGWEGDELAGRYGLEKKFDGLLSRNKDNPYINFFAEVFTDLKNTLFSGDDRGGDVITTIEPAAESFLEKELGSVRAKYNADAVGGVIMNPHDGSIYAMTTVPNFDPNYYGEERDISIYSNPIVESAYEFGSVVKPLVMASAIDAGVLTAETTYDDQGYVMVDKGKWRIDNFDDKGRGQGVSMQEVLSQSLNTGMVFVYKRLGKQKMHDYLLGYDINKKTDIDLPGEVVGSARNLEEGLRASRDIEYANASFGQGISMTPIGITRALAALANGGVMVTPHVVSEIKYTDGTSKKFEYEGKPTKISKVTAEEITRMMVLVMDKGIRGGASKLEHWSVAVKTGTAQVPSPDGGYYDDRYNHSFVGVFPAYNPRFIVFLYAIDPKGVRYASETWTDPFLNITKFLLNYYEVPPDR